MCASPVKPREWEKTLTVKCRLCGGAKCKRCSESAALAKTDSPVHGLHADWVADRMLGMMRPSSRIMKDYQIAQQFHKLRIAAVFNLTLPGEHPYCGDGLVPSGFPYDPETDLMAEKIRFYNFGWEDMTVPTRPFMLDIVKVMASVLQDGHSKLAVHCHAGYGRTGLAIACCLIFMHSIPPDRAITIVRRDRPGSIQTSAQAKFVRLFHEYIHASKVVFALPTIHDRFSLDEMVEQQNRMVHGDKCTGSRLALPRVLDFLCREVEKCADGNAVAVIQAYIFHLLWQGYAHNHAPEASGGGSGGGAGGGGGGGAGGAGRRAVLCDYADLQDKHGKAVWGESYTSETTIAIVSPVDPTVSAIPPPVPASLTPPVSSAHHSVVSQEELFPIKVAFNIGEWNWHEALQLSHTTTASSTACTPTAITSVPHTPALLLDWLEHLAEPLLPMEIVAQVDACSDESPVTKYKPLNQLPSCVVRSLDRVLCCLRYLLKKADTAPATTVNALCVRTAMAMFHLQASTPVAMLCKHSAFVLQVAREWQPPKRLELNFESLHKLGKSNSQRRLSHSSSKNGLVPPETLSVASPSTSPTRISPEFVLGVSLEPMVHARVHIPPALAPATASETLSSPKLKEQPTELSPLKQSHTSHASPQLQLSPQPQRPVPPVDSMQLPPMTREKDDQEAEPSPVKKDGRSPIKTDSLAPRSATSVVDDSATTTTGVSRTCSGGSSSSNSSSSSSSRKEQVHHEALTGIAYSNNSSERETAAAPLLMPTPPSVAPLHLLGGEQLESDREKVTGAVALHTSSAPYLNSPPPLTRGSGSGGNVYTLPSVKAGDRYKNRIL